MEGRPQRHLALILARELASQLATAAFIADATGGLVFFNEPAEEILGRTFAEAGPMPAALTVPMTRPAGRSSLDSRRAGSETAPGPGRRVRARR